MERALKCESQPLPVECNPKRTMCGGIVNDVTHHIMNFIVFWERRTAKLKGRYCSQIHIFPYKYFQPYIHPEYNYYYISFIFCIQLYETSLLCHQ